MQKNASISEEDALCWGYTNHSACTRSATQAERVACEVEKAWLAQKRQELEQVQKGIETILNQCTR